MIKRTRNATWIPMTYWPKICVVRRSLPRSIFDRKRTRKIRRRIRDSNTQLKIWTAWNNSLLNTTSLMAADVARQYLTWMKIRFPARNASNEQTFFFDSFFVLNSYIITINPWIKKRDPFLNDLKMLKKHSSIFQVGQYASSWMDGLWKRGFGTLKNVRNNAEQKRGSELFEFLLLS